MGVWLSSMFVRKADLCEPLALMASRSLSVRDLFDRKAEQWTHKYQMGGALEYRSALFKHIVGELCPSSECILDFGCGTGHIAASLAKEGHSLVGCDMSSAMLAEAECLFGEAVQFCRLEPNWTTLPFSTGEFGLVMASSVLEYVEDVALVLSELARIVRPGGFLLMTVPNMRHPKRWLETAVAFTFCQGPLWPLMRRFERFSLYGHFLRTSKNRYSARQWFAKCSAVDLALHRQQSASPGIQLLVMMRDI